MNGDMILGALELVAFAFMVKYTVIVIGGLIRNQHLNSATLWVFAWSIAIFLDLKGVIG